MHKRQQAADRITVKIAATEMLGHEMLVYCRPAGSVRINSSDIIHGGDAPGSQWIIRLPADDTMHANAALELAVDNHQLRLFREDGTALERNTLNI